MIYVYKCLNCESENTLKKTDARTHDLYFYCATCGCETTQILVSLEIEGTKFKKSKK